MLTTKKELVQCWLALILTGGEISICVWLIIYHGNFVYLYLFATYTMRETSGGHHYHEILVRAYHKVCQHKRHVEDNPFYKL